MRRNPSPSEMPDGVVYADQTALEVAREMKRAVYWKSLQTRRAETKGTPGRCPYCGRVPGKKGTVVHEIGCFRP